MAAENVTLLWNIIRTRCKQLPGTIVCHKFFLVVCLIALLSWTDRKVPSHSGFTWSAMVDVEILALDPHTEHSFVVSLEDGTVRGYDSRAAKSDKFSESQSSFTLHAHDKAVCTVLYSPAAPKVKTSLIPWPDYLSLFCNIVLLDYLQLLVTVSTGKMVKLWDLSNNQPSGVASQNPKAVWDTLCDAAVSRKFGNHSRLNKPKAYRGKL